jgi:hypothetical protein
MFRLAAAAGASILSIAVAFPAAASTVSVTNISFSDGWSLINVSNPPGGAVAAPYKAGRYALTTTNPTDTLLLWCVDLYRTLGIGVKNPAHTWTVSSLTPDGPDLPFTLDAAQLSRITGLAAAGDQALLSDPGNGGISAAYQAAIWETIYTNSDFTSSNATVQALINDLNSADFDGEDGLLYQRLDSKGLPIAQQLIGAPGPDPVNPIPLPGALGLFGFALAGLVVARRAKA